MKKKDQESLRKIVIIGLVLVVGYLGYQSMTSGSSPFSEASEPGMEEFPSPEFPSPELTSSKQPKECVNTNEGAYCGCWVYCYFKDNLTRAYWNDPAMIKTVLRCKTTYSPAPNVSCKGNPLYYK